MVKSSHHIIEALHTKTVLKIFVLVIQKKAWLTPTQASLLMVWHQLRNHTVSFSQIIFYSCCHTSGRLGRWQWQRSKDQFKNDAIQLQKYLLSVNAFLGQHADHRPICHHGTHVQDHFLYELGYTNEHTDKTYSVTSTTDPCHKHTTYPFLRTRWASLRKSATFVPIRDRQKTAMSTLLLPSGT